jgi:SAM-dependent methyltransferase
MTNRPSPPRASAANPARWLGADDAALFDEAVVPRYLALFGERLLAMIASGPDARVCHVGCRTGYPAKELLAKLPGVHVHGCDASEHAVARARRNADSIPGLVVDYRIAPPGGPLPYPDGSFSHAFALHPLAAPEERARMLEELARVVAPNGQALVAMPLRGSFVEIQDLLRECALKHELADLTAAVEAAALLRPTDEIFAKELEAVGFEFVEVDVRPRTLKFDGGKAFFDDPVAQSLLLPEFRVNLAIDVAKPFQYVREAIDKYWSDAPFELTVHVGCVSGRRKA